MTLSNTAGIQRKPTHSGEILREDFIPDYGLTVAQRAVDLWTVAKLTKEAVARIKPLDVA